MESAAIWLWSAEPVPAAPSSTNPWNRGAPGSADASCASPRSMRAMMSTSTSGSAVSSSAM